MTNKDIYNWPNLSRGSRVLQKKGKNNIKEKVKVIIKTLNTKYVSFSYLFEKKKKS